MRISDWSSDMCSSDLQLNTPDHMRGRVSAASGLAISASNELGEMRAGAMAAALGPVGAVVIGGAGAIGVTALWARSEEHPSDLQSLIRISYSVFRFQTHQNLHFHSDKHFRSAYVQSVILHLML